MRLTDTLKLKNVLFGIVLTLVVSDAWAGPITASHVGCLSDFANESKTATWESSRHFRWVVLWQDDAGCAATDSRAIGLNGVFERIVNADGSERVVVNQSLLPTCGRGQMDAQDTGEFTDEMLEILAVVFNTGVDCKVNGDAMRRYAYTGSVDEPDTLERFGLPVPSGAPNWEPDSPTPFETSVTVPDHGSTMVLLGTGLACVACFLALTAKRK